MAHSTAQNGCDDTVVFESIYMLLKRSEKGLSFEVTTSFLLCSECLSQEWRAARVRTNKWQCKWEDDSTHNREDGERESQLLLAIPYIAGLSENIRCMCRNYNIRVVSSQDGHFGLCSPESRIHCKKNNESRTFVMWVAHLDLCLFLPPIYILHNHFLITWPQYSPKQLLW